MNIRKFFIELFSDSSRLYLRNVEPGDHIAIEWDKIEGGIAHPKCINNDPKTKTIL